MQTISLTLTDAEAFALNEALDAARQALVIKAMHQRVNGNAYSADLTSAREQALGRTQRRLAQGFEALTEVSTHLNHAYTPGCCSFMRSVHPR